MTRASTISWTGSLLIAAILLALARNAVLSAPVPKDTPSIAVKFADKMAIPDIAIDSAAFIDESKVVVVGTKANKDGEDANKLEPNGAILDLIKKDHAPFTNGHKARIGTVSVSGNRIVTSSNALDPTVRIWDVKKGKTIYEIKIEEPGEGCHQYGVACFHKSGRVAVAARQKMIVIDPAKSDDRSEYDIPNNSAWLGEELAVSSDDTWIAAPALKGHATFWSVASKKASSISLIPEKAEVEDQWRSSGVVFGTRGTLFAWRVNSSSEVPEKMAEADVSAERRGVVQIDTSGKRVVPRKIGHGNSTLSCAIDPTGEWMATGGSSRKDRPLTADTSTSELRIYHLPTGTLVHREQLEGLPLNKVAFSPSGKRLIATTYDGNVRWWDVEAK